MSRTPILFALLVALALTACPSTEPDDDDTVTSDDDDTVLDDDDSVVDDDDSGPVDDDDSGPLDDDDSGPVDDDDSGPVDDDDSGPLDDDDSGPLDDDDSGPVDDDDSGPVDDDDSGPLDDDDSVVDDDDSGPVDDDDSAPDDDDSAPDDDDSASDDDDSAVDDDDSAVEPETCGAAWTLGCGVSGADSHNNGDAGSTSVVDSWSCDAGLSETGPEYVYEIMTPVPASYTLELTGLTDDLDLFLLDGDADCDPSSCIDHSAGVGTADESITFVATAGQTFHVAVDGFSGAVSDYTLSLTCPECATDYPLNCVQDSDSWTNGIGASNSWEDYACTVYADDETGPEYVYVFNVDADGTATVDLTGLTADLDLFVMGADASGGCDPAECSVSSSNSSISDESVTWPVLAGEVWYVVVDGFQGATSWWSIDLTCL